MSIQNWLPSERPGEKLMEQGHGGGAARGFLLAQLRDRPYEVFRCL
jgi:hypothetical protein